MNYLTNKLFEIFIESAFNLFLVFIAGIAFTSSSQNKAKRLENDAILLQVKKSYYIIGFLFLIMAGFLVSKVKSISGVGELLILVTLISFFIVSGLITIIGSFETIEISSEKIRDYNLFAIGKKRFYLFETAISWDDVDSIKYDEFQTKLEIISGKKNIHIGIMHIGLDDFVAMLRKRYGDMAFGLSLEKVENDIIKHRKYHHVK